MGPNIISVELVNDTVYSVEGHNFVTGFSTQLQDGAGQIVEGVTTSEPSATRFTLTLPYATTGPCTLTVSNPDGRTATLRFGTPETTDSNQRLRADS